MSVSTISIVPMLFSIIAAASSAWSCWQAWRMASRMRSHELLSDEISRVDASVLSLIKIVRRIEGRQTARQSNAVRAAASNGKTQVPLIAGMLDNASIRANPALASYARFLEKEPEVNDDGDSDPT